MSKIKLTEVKFENGAWVKKDVMELDISKGFSFVPHDCGAVVTTFVVDPKKGLTGETSVFVAETTTEIFELLNQN